MGRIEQVRLNGVDCDGVLPWRIDRPLFEEWESFE